MESVERARLDAYFSKITSRFRPEEQPSSLLVTHLLPERPSFVRAVGAVSSLRAVLPKPKSIVPSAQREVEAIAQCDGLDRELFADADRAVEYVENRAAGERLVLLDVGGYFAPTLTTLRDRFSGTILGVVEDTENGHKRYAELDKLPCPVVSVARSPLKDPEDFLVGQSVVFSTEALMRGRGDILHGRPALVIGFGKLGSSIARLLHAKGVQVTVYDIDPVRRAQALSQGFTVARDRDTALHNAGLVLCATGSISLRSEDFSTLRNGAYVPRSPAARTSWIWPISRPCTSAAGTPSTSPGTGPPGTISICSTVATPSTSCTAPAWDRSSSSCRPRYSPPSGCSPGATSRPVCTRCPQPTGPPSPTPG